MSEAHATPTPRRQLPPLSVLIAAVVVAVVVVWVCFAGLIVPNSMAQNLTLGATGAWTPGHVFGTDDLGRDVLAMAIAGARSALVGPLVIAIGSAVVGIVLGSLAGYAGGWIDAVVSRWTDLVLALPGILLAIVVAGVVDGGYWATVALLIVLFSPSDIRIVRAAVLQERHKPYVEAPTVLGISRPRIVVRHILPNIRAVVLANLFLNIAYALVSMSSLSYLGLGVSPAQADWGRQLSDARNLLFTNGAAAIVPGVLIIATAGAINLLGDWFADRSAESAR